MTQKERADMLVVSRGYADSRQKARALIMAGLVYSEGIRVEKAGQLIPRDRKLTLKERAPYVSRGGLKLKEALDVFRISVKGKVAADLGASTGGFTDCLLQEGADKVYAVDVEPRQIDSRLRNDPRVVLIKKNARYLENTDFQDALDVIVMDLSFISVLKVLPALKTLIGNGTLLVLIKPQFEVGKGKVGKKGIVRNPAQHEEVLERVVREAGALSFSCLGVMKTTVLGQKGNQEFFVRWSLEKASLDPAHVKKTIKEAVWDE
jgi:23S rRNA (cytidine1920-2'-O)/16S rRNA (cytidine1409-2'-O)-methyltransferase